MENADYSIILDVTDMSAPVSLNVKQGDAGRVIAVNLARDGVPVGIEPGSYAVFAGKKPDEKILWNSCSIRDSTIFYEITKQTTAVVGWVPVQIRLYRPGGKLVSSPDFVLIVDGTVTDDEEVVIVSENEVTALTELVSEAADAIEHAMNVEGKSAYQVAQEAGFEGTVEEWLDSLVGPKGDEGDPGPQGPQGDPGPQGEPGKEGGSTTITLRYGVSSTPSMNTITGWQDTIPQMSETYPYLWIEITTETTTATGGSSTIEAGIIGYYSTPDSDGNADYVLPVGGEKLGGVKNGGNVVINEDGTMTAPESTGGTVELDTTLTKEGMAADAKAVGDALKEVGQPTDEQIAGAVSDWIEANPDKVTTVQDESITREKIENTLLEELGLEHHHHLTEESVPIYISQYAAWEVKDGNSATRCTQLFRVPQYVRVKNISTVSVEIYMSRFANVQDMDSEEAVFKIESNGTIKRNRHWYPKGTRVETGEEVTFPTHEYGRVGFEYLQLMFQVGGSYGTKDLLEVTAIYDDWRPTYKLPEEGEVYAEDLPMRWVYQGFNNSKTTDLWCVVPYYPGFTYSVRGGNMATILKNTVETLYLMDDSIFDTYDLGLVMNSGSVGYIHLIVADSAVQYDTSVNGGANNAYNWTYHTTPPESELTGPKWVAFKMTGTITQDAVGDLGLDYYNSLIQAINDGTERNRYVTRWAEQIPRRIFSTLVRKSGELQDDGTRFTALLATTTNPLANAKWVLFGDSLADSYGGKNYGSDYFASRIAREFGMKMDNRAKSGSNIYAGGSGNYTAVSGIVMLDEYLAEIEAGTTEQADYITVAFGTNTFSAQLGTNADTSETNTSVYGATKYFIEKIREKVPNAVLGFVLSPRQNWGSADPGGARDVDGGRTAIKTVCDEYGVPYIDMSTQSGITVAMLPDGIHISNDQSQKLYYHAMRRFVMGL